jgi:hypothetical protein
MAKVFEPVVLPLSVKEQLCTELLAEFGATSIRHRPGRQELIHGCLVAPEEHSNQERDPSASLNYETLTYKCLGCQRGGGLLWLISELRDCTWEEAREWLGRETGTGGVVMPLQQLLAYYDALYADAVRRPPPMPSYAPSVLDPWLGFVHPWLTTGAPDLGIPTGRGIPEQNVIDLKIGWDPDDDTIVIPHFWKSSLVGWQKRRLSGSGPKYMSTEDMPKDHTLYDHDPKSDTAVICESPMSVARHRHAIPFRATFGGDVTDRQIKIISGYYKRLVLWMDNDSAGWRSTESMIERLAPYCPVWVVDSPFAGDPADLDTERAEWLVGDAVAASAWRRPGMLVCPRCESRAHRGDCPA